MFEIGRASFRGFSRFRQNFPESGIFQKDSREYSENSAEEFYISFKI